MLGLVEHFVELHSKCSKTSLGSYSELDSAAGSTCTRLQCCKLKQLGFSSQAKEFPSADCNNISKNINEQRGYPSWLLL